MLSLLLLALAAPPSGVDRPEWTLERSLGPSADADGERRLRCLGYRGFVVVELTDPAIKGARVEVRSSTLAADRAGLCAERLAGARLVGEELSFTGAAAPYLLLEAVDGLGLASEIGVADARTGRMVTRVVADVSRPVRARRGATTSLELVAVVTVTCDLLRDTKACWRETKTRQGLPSALPAPRCAEAYARAKVGGDDPAQIAIRARIPDLSRPKLELWGAPVECAPQP